MTPGCTVSRCPTSASAASSARSSSSSAASDVPPWCLPRARCAAALDVAAAEADGMKCLKMSACLSRNCMRFWRRVACVVGAEGRGRGSVCEVGSALLALPCSLPTSLARGASQARAPHPNAHASVDKGGRAWVGVGEAPLPPRFRFHPPILSTHLVLRKRGVLTRLELLQLILAQLLDLAHALTLAAGDLAQGVVGEGGLWVEGREGTSKKNTKPRSRQRREGPSRARPQHPPPFPQPWYRWTRPCRCGGGRTGGRVGRPRPFFGRKTESPACVRARSGQSPPPALLLSPPSHSHPRPRCPPPRRSPRPRAGPPRPTARRPRWRRPSRRRRTRARPARRATRRATTCVKCGACVCVCVAKGRCAARARHNTGKRKKSVWNTKNQRRTQNERERH